MDGAEMTFPTVSGSNLLRQKRILPQDFQGKLNLVFIAFQQWHQMEVDSWIPLAKELEQRYEDLAYYELPTIQSMNSLSKMFINEGMRAGIPNPKTRDRTITLYLNKKDFRAALGMPDEDHIYILLIDRQGMEYFRGRGRYTQESEVALRQALLQLISFEKV
jgi:ATP10 protein